MQPRTNIKIKTFWFFEGMIRLRPKIKNFLDCYLFIWLIHVVVATLETYQKIISSKYVYIKSIIRVFYNQNSLQNVTFATRDLNCRAYWRPLDTVNIFKDTTIKSPIKSPIKLLIGLKRVNVLRENHTSRSENPVYLPGSTNFSSEVLIDMSNAGKIY